MADPKKVTTIYKSSRRTLDVLPPEDDDASITATKAAAWVWHLRSAETAETAGKLLVSHRSWHCVAGTTAEVRKPSRFCVEAKSKAMPETANITEANSRIMPECTATTTTDAGVWDCGSILYDTFELVSFSDRLDRSMLALPSLQQRPPCYNNSYDNDDYYSHWDSPPFYQLPRTQSLPRSSTAAVDVTEAKSVNPVAVSLPAATAKPAPKSRHRLQIFSKLAKLFSSRRSVILGRSRTSPVESSNSAINDDDGLQQKLRTPAKTEAVHSESDSSPVKSETAHTDQSKFLPCHRVIHHHHHHYLLKPPLPPAPGKLPVLPENHVTSFRPRSDSARLSSHTMAKLCTEQAWV